MRRGDIPCGFTTIVVVFIMIIGMLMIVIGGKNCCCRVQMGKDGGIMVWSLLITVFGGLLRCLILCGNSAGPEWVNRGFLINTKTLASRLLFKRLLATEFAREESKYEVCA